MNAWLKNARKNLLPLSEEKENFNKALTEWAFTGETVDYENAEEFCQLCEMEGLRYHYQIANTLQNILWVGSKCIERFDIVVLDEEGSEVSKSEKETYLKNRLRDKHIQDVLLALEERPSFGSIKQFKKSYLDQYCFAQLQKLNVHARILNYLFLRLDEEGIYYNKRFFSIDIRSKVNKEKLQSLNKIQFERLKGALSRSQITFYQKNVS
jgi:hypothetical protein